MNFFQILVALEKTELKNIKHTMHRYVIVLHHINKMKAENTFVTGKVLQDKNKRKHITSDHLEPYHEPMLWISHDY